MTTLTPVPVTQRDREAAEMKQALQRARATAMRFTVEARIPECGKFGEIAQDLDAIVQSLDTVFAHHAEQARLEERERAAKIADAVAEQQEAEGEGGGREWATSTSIATAIRNGETA